jgi:hypothetical protein
MATEIEVTTSDDDVLSWRRAGAGLLECRSHALRDADGRVWLVDPLDGAGLDEALEDFGEVAGVIVLFDRHLRSAPTLARRYGARLIVPPGRWRRGGARRPDDAELLAEQLEGCPFRFVPIVEREGQWLEWALWWSERRTLVVPEAVGSAQWYRSRSREPLAVHPVLRVVAPPRSLLDLHLDAEPERLLLGHGDDLDESVHDSLELAVHEARRELPWYALAAPRHAVRFVRAAVGAGRASC